MPANPALGLRNFDSRLAVVESDVAGIQRATNKIEQDMARMEAAITSGFNQFNDRLSQSQRTQWPVIWSGVGVLVAVLIAIGGLAYAPIKGQLDNTKESFERFQKENREEQKFFVTRQEVAALSARRDKEIEKQERALDRIVESLVPRGEHAEKWRASDQRAADLQRQLDEIKRSLGDTYGVRDVLLRLERRVDGLEERRRERPPAVPRPSGGSDGPRAIPPAAGSG